MRSTFVIVDSTDNSGPELISLEDLKAALEIEGTDDDEALQAKITRYSNLFADICGRRFAFAEAIETFTFMRDEVLLPRQALTLRLYPVVGFNSVAINDEAHTDYEADLESGRVWFDGGWQGEIEVRYSGGYDLPDGAPAGLREAVIEAIRSSRASASSATRDPSIQSVSHGDRRVSYFQGGAESSSGTVSTTAFDLLKPYRRLAYA